MLAIVDELEAQLGGNPGDALIAARYHAIGNIVEQSVRTEDATRFNLTEALDRVLLNRVLAFPVLLGIMYLMFMFTINVGGAFIDFFDIAAGALFVEAPRVALTAAGLPAWLVTAVVDGIGGGVQLVASFIPVIATLFLFQSFLEDSGYMARAAFILDRLMRAIGLPGKSFVPLLVGFGCNVPAVMATRIMRSRALRLLSMLVIPFSLCSARLQVFLFLIGLLFTPLQAPLVLMSLYLVSLLTAMLTALLFGLVQLQNKIRRTHTIAR